MYPCGHLAVGYVAYTGWRRIRSGTPPAERAVFVLVFATQFPDIVDKSLQFGLGLHDGRSIGHSLLVVLPLCVGVFAVARLYGSEDIAAPFTIGVLSHLTADSVPALVSNSTRPEPTYLLWPILEPPSYEIQNPEEHVDRVLAAVQGQTVRQVASDLLFFEGAMVLFLAVLWAIDGFPGGRAVWRFTVDRLSNT